MNTSTVKIKKFGKYEVTLELWQEYDENRSFCDIVNTVSGACGSLPLAQDMGFLETDNFQEEKISDKVLNQIEEWAYENGY